MAVTALTGNGTLTSPFRVYSADQLSTVATTINQSSYTTTTNSGTVYINLMSDITLTGTMITFTNSSNPIIIDGTTTQNNTGNSFIYFTGSSTSGSGLFTLNSRNMTITFKNINFGSKLSAKNNYYGFCQTTQANSTINIQNVNYYAEDGGQPFYATGNNSVLNFLGTNTFVVANTTSSNQEFAEFAGTINFKTGSKTAIVQKTRAALAFIWAYTGITMNVESDAQVFIQSGKTELFYPNRAANLNVAESAQFTYLFDNNLTYIDPQTVFGDPSTYQTISVSGTTGASSNNFFNGNTTLNISTAKNAQLNFITANLPFQTGTLAINSQDSSSVKFINQTKTSSALNSSNTSLRATNSTTNNTIYNFVKYPTGNGTVTPISELILPNASSATLTTTLPNYNTLIFEPAVKVGGLSATGTSGFDINSKTPFSGISSQLTGVSSTLDSNYTYKAQYYITNNTSIVLDDTTLNNRYDETATTATHIDGSINTVINTLPTVSTTTSDQATTATLKDLYSGGYTVYGRLAIIPNSSSNQTYYTTWKHATTTINPYQAVTFPTLINLNDNISYHSFNNKLGLTFNKNITYPISNQSNQVIDVLPTTLTANTQNDVSIVPNTPGSNYDKSLQLLLTSNTPSIQWNFASLATPSTLELQPYWDTTNNKALLYLDGAYSGPYITTSPANVDYTLSFTIHPK